MCANDCMAGLLYSAELTDNVLKLFPIFAVMKL